MFKRIVAATLFFPLYSSSWAAPAPETVLTEKCLNAYQKTYKNRKNNKAFVYAREEDTGKDRCQWNYGNSDLKTATNKAIQACAKHQLNAECIVVDQNGEYLVKDGDYSIITPVDKTPLSQSDKDKLLAEAKQLVRGNCVEFYENHLNDKGHRVFAYAIDPDGKYACGKSKGGNLVSVRLSAMKACTRNIRSRGSKKPTSECKIYAENKEILLSASDYGVTIDTAEVKTLTDDEINGLLDQAKQTITKGPCQFQMKYYLGGGKHQAFYLATDDQGKQACGWTESAFTPEVAKKEALDSCKANVRKQRLKAECEIFAESFKIVAMPKSEPAVDAIDEVKSGEKPETKPEPVKAPKKVVTPEEDFKRAIFRGNLGKIKEHIDAGLDVNTLAKDGMSPLFVAAAKGDADFFKQLLEKGADIKHKGNQGSDVLIAATFGANEKLIQLLLDKGFDVNTQGREGYTPLHLALLNKNEPLIKFLIGKGADTSIKNNEGINATELAKKLEIDLK